VALDEQNKRDLLARGFGDIKKLGDFGSYDSQDIPDPYNFNGLDGFEEVYKMIDECVSDLLQKH
jgi:protein-tyrosine phosphatase